MNVVVLTNVPSPYQVELLDAVAGRGTLLVRAVYLKPRGAGRRWEQPRPQHEHRIVAGDATAHRTATEWLSSADLVVFSNYRHPDAMTWLRDRAASNRAWCFWGERPGFAGLGVLGRLFRRWNLAPLAHSHAPIWGMGNWAVAAYRSEFGHHRAYFNVPYSSDLARFTPLVHGRGPVVAGERRILFSGSLIRRKGVDLLAHAFSRVAAIRPHARLDLLGEGPLQSALQDQLTKWGSRVRFLGFHQWRDLPSVYHAADVLCVPSRYDGWGLVVPEGLAAGLPVIATDKTGAALDLIRTGSNGNGWVVPAGQVEPLADALGQAIDLGDAELAVARIRAIESIAANGLQDGVDRFISAVVGSLAAWDGVRLGEALDR